MNNLILGLVILSSCSVLSSSWPSVSPDNAVFDMKYKDSIIWKIKDLNQKTLFNLECVSNDEYVHCELNLPNASFDENRSLLIVPGNGKDIGQLGTFYKNPSTLKICKGHIGLDISRTFRLRNMRLDLVYDSAKNTLSYRVSKDQAGNAKIFYGGDFDSDCSKIYKIEPPICREKKDLSYVDCSNGYYSRKYSWEG